MQYSLYQLFWLFTFYAVYAAVAAAIWRCSVYGGLASIYLLIILISFTAEYVHHSHSAISTIDDSNEQRSKLEFLRWVLAVSISVVSILISGSSPDEPTVFQPYPLLFVSLLVVPLAVIWLPGASYLLLTFGIFSTKHRFDVPLRISVFLGSLTIASFTWFAYFARGALAVYGWPYLTGNLITNLIGVGALWGSWWVLRQRWSALSVLSWMFAVHLWLFWCAFPALVDIAEVAADLRNRSS